MYRDHTKVVQIGDRKIGGGNPILIQSMTKHQDRRYRRNCKADPGPGGGRLRDHPLYGTHYRSGQGSKGDQKADPYPPGGGYPFRL